MRRRIHFARPSPTVLRWKRRRQAELQRERNYHANAHLLLPKRDRSDSDIYENHDYDDRRKRLATESERLLEKAKELDEDVKNLISKVTEDDGDAYASDGESHEKTELKIYLQEREEAKKQLENDLRQERTDNVNNEDFSNNGGSKDLEQSSELTKHDRDTLDGLLKDYLAPGDIDDDYVQETRENLEDHCNEVSNLRKELDSIDSAPSDNNINPGERSGTGQSPSGPDQPSSTSQGPSDVDQTDFDFSYLF